MALHKTPIISTCSSARLDALVSKVHGVKSPNRAYTNPAVICRLPKAGLITGTMQEDCLQTKCESCNLHVHVPWT